MKWEDVGLVLEDLDRDGVLIQLQRRRSGEWSVDVSTPRGVWVSLEGDLPSTLEDAARAARGAPEIVWAAEVAQLTQRLHVAVSALRRLRNEPCERDQIVWTDIRDELSHRLREAVAALRQLPEEPSQTEVLNAGLDALLAASGIEGVL